jgi:hypothetical protein
MAIPDDLWGEPSSVAERMLEAQRLIRLQEQVKADQQRRSRELDANTAQIHWDAAMWKKTMEHLPANIRKWVSDNRKTSKRYIQSDPLIRLNRSYIPGGFFVTQMTSHAVGRNYVLSDSSLLTVETTDQIEKAIILAAVQSGYLPRTVQYKGRILFEERDEPLQSAACGFVYFVRNGDIYKIGITENLMRRFTEIKPDEVLDVIRCANYKDLEKRLHSEFKDDRIPQTEYFRLNSVKISTVHILMRQWSEA